MLALFLGLGLFAWWTFRTVSLPPDLRDLFEEDEAIAAAAIPPTEEERFQQELARLPAPPQNHAPQVATLVARLRELQNVPPILVQAVQRDKATPKDQTPPPWSETEWAALNAYQAKFLDAWESFFSAPIPEWANFPDSALYFRSQFPLLSKESKDLFSYGFYEPGRPESWTLRVENQPDFFLRLFRQCTYLGTLRFGILSGWTVSDTVAAADYSEQTIQKSKYFFFQPNPVPEQILGLAVATPTTSSLREGLKTDRAVFLRTAEFLQSLPAETSAHVSLTRVLGNQRDAEWFLRRIGHPQTSRELAILLRHGADQIALLEQKTFLSAPAWRQWLSGNIGDGLNPVLREALAGMQEFEEKTAEYRVALAFLQASAGYRKSGVEGMKNIPDPARPGSFLRVTTSTNTITLSSGLKTRKGKDYSFSLDPAQAP